MKLRDVPDRRVGQVVAERYRIDALIGRGGFGAVYRATNLAMAQPVALKFLHAAHLHDETQLRRFQQEASRSSRLKHPNTSGRWPELHRYFRRGHLDATVRGSPRRSTPSW